MENTIFIPSQYRQAHVGNRLFLNDQLVGAVNYVLFNSEGQPAYYINTTTTSGGRSSVRVPHIDLTRFTTRIGRRFKHQRYGIRDSKD